jgi:hypothetical protein
LQEGTYYLPAGLQISEAGIQFLQSCLQQDPSERAAWPTLLYGYLEEPSYVKLASKTLEDQLELSTSKVLAKEVSLELLS